MKLYLTKHGMAHAELDLDELTTIQSCLFYSLSTWDGIATKAGPLHERFKGLVTAWLAGDVARVGPGASVRPVAASDTPGTPLPTPCTLDPGNRVNPDKPV